jgi:hypothetical protein
MSALRNQVPGSVPILGSFVRAAQTATHRPVLGFPTSEHPASSGANAETVQAEKPGGPPLVQALVSSSTDQPQPSPSSVSRSSNGAAVTNARAATVAVATSTLGSDVPATTAATAVRSQPANAWFSPGNRSAKRQVKAASLDPERLEAKAQQPRSRARQALSVKQRLARATPVQEETPAPQAGANRERMHLLGVPLPTGSELKQCLLEFRC